MGMRIMDQVGEAGAGTTEQCVDDTGIPEDIETDERLID